jgi:hypothetical protein
MPGFRIKTAGNALFSFTPSIVYLKQNKRLVNIQVHRSSLHSSEIGRFNSRAL